MSVYPISTNAHYLSRRSMGQQSHSKVKASSVLPKGEEAMPRWRETNRPADALIARRVGESGDASPSQGNGAPLIDPVERYRGQAVAASQISTSARVELEQRNKRQQAVKSMLDEQLEEKRWRQSEEDRRKELEDHLEEERIDRQRREMEEEYRRELLSREGYTVSSTPQPMVPAAPVEPVRRPVVIRPPRMNPSPGPYFNSFGRKPRYSKEDEMHPRERALEDVITQMKAASVMQSEHTQEVLLDFERMRTELHRMDRRAWERPSYEFGKLQQDSRFLPLANAGKAVVGPNQPTRVPSSVGLQNLVPQRGKNPMQKLDDLMGLGEQGRSESGVVKRMGEKTWEDSMEGDKDVEQSLGILKEKFDVEESAKFSEP